jgi:hypothetical protein
MEAQATSKVVPIVLSYLQQTNHRLETGGEYAFDPGHHERLRTRRQRATPSKQRGVA